MSVRLAAYELSGVSLGGLRLGLRGVDGAEQAQQIQEAVHFLEGVFSRSDAVFGRDIFPARCAISEASNVTWTGRKVGSLSGAIIRPRGHFLSI